MSRFMSNISHRNTNLDAFNPPFPLAGAALGLIAVVNVVSAVTMLLSV